MDFLRFAGPALKLGSPISAAITGTSGQLLSTLATANALAVPLLKLVSPTPGTFAAEAAVRASYEAVNATWAVTRDGSGALSNATRLAALYAKTYAYALERVQAEPLATRRLLQTQRTAAELQELFNGVASVSGGGLAGGTGKQQDLGPLLCWLGHGALVPLLTADCRHPLAPPHLPLTPAQVVSSANAAVQALVAQAVAAAATGDPTYGPLSALLEISANGFVVQHDLTQNMRLVMKRVLEQNANITAELESLAQVRLRAGRAGAAVVERLARTPPCLAPPPQRRACPRCRTSTNTPCRTTRVLPSPRASRACSRPTPTSCACSRSSGRASATAAPGATTRRTTSR